MSFTGSAFKFLIFLIVILAAAYGGYVYGQTVLQESLFEVNIPINQTFSFELNQSVDIPIKTKVDFPLSDSFIVNESVPIITFIELNEVLRVPLSLPTGDVVVDVPIKKTIPINTSIMVYKKIEINKNISLDIDKQLAFVINKNISVPVNMEVVTKVPVPDWMKK
jgi:hypothetical protein